MRKTMVYLEDDQFLLLKKAAASSRKRMSEIIREALSGYLKEETKEKLDYFSFIGIAEGLENGRTSEQAKEVLRKVGEEVIRKVEEMRFSSLQSLRLIAIDSFFLLYLLIKPHFY